MIQASVTLGLNYCNMPHVRLPLTVQKLLVQCMTARVVGCRGSVLAAGQFLGTIQGVGVDL